MVLLGPRAQIQAWWGRSGARTFSSPFLLENHLLERQLGGVGTPAV